jgi:AcrR family transcriptional regulator
MAKRPRSKASTTGPVRRQLYSELFPTDLSKSEKRKLEILEGAVRAYASVDINHVSYDDVAAPAGTSRRLVQHYFPDKNELFATTMKLIRAMYQASVIDSISKAETPLERFSEYIRAAVNWAHLQPIHVRIWILYYLVCAQQMKFRELHEEMADVGEARIVALISEIQGQKKSTESDLKFAAKTVQRLICGALIEICSERVAPDVKRVADDAVRASLMILDGIRTTPAA